jgi:hypothetical protein
MFAHFPTDFAISFMPPILSIDARTNGASEILHFITLLPRKKSLTYGTPPSTFLYKLQQIGCIKYISDDSDCSLQPDTSNLKESGWKSNRDGGYPSNVDKVEIYGLSRPISTTSGNSTIAIIFSSAQCRTL